MNNKYIYIKYTYRKNIDYGTSRKLDVYYNESTISQLKPVVIHIYGGAWVKGNS